jgi:hypothetical protein
MADADEVAEVVAFWPASVRATSMAAINVCGGIEMD